MSDQQQWETRYHQKKTGWDRGDINPQLRVWLEKNVLQPCRILVPGCGNGHEVLTLAAAGFEVVAIDIATTPVKRLRDRLKQHNLKAEVVQGNLLSWEHEIFFDVIYEQTCLCALPQDTWTQYERKLYGWLKPQGKIFALFMQTQQQGGPPFHCELSEMQNLFSESRWFWHAEESQIPHPAGFYELAYVLEKAKE